MVMDALLSYWHYPEEQRRYPATKRELHTDREALHNGMGADLLRR